MKKILSIAIVIFLLFSGIGAIGLQTQQTMDNNTDIETKSNFIELSFEPFEIINDQMNYQSLEIKSCESYITNPGSPMLPKMIKTFEIPFSSSNIKINVDVKETKEMDFNGEIKPAPTPIPMLPNTDLNIIKPLEKDDSIYQNDEYFPHEWYNYYVKGGINKNGEHVTFVIVHFYPVKYKPVSNKILSCSNVDIMINYEKPNKNIFPEESTYDMVIITSEAFNKKPVQKLIDHKNSLGIKTFLKTTDDIYQEYTGMDEPEQIKYFIKDAIETYGIKYVLLLGGLKNKILAKPRDTPNAGVSAWHVPVRYTNCFDNPEHPLLSSSIHDPGVISDLYYADIYDGKGHFSTWNTHEDNFIAAWGRDGVVNDTDIDWVPDVMLGRLACRNIVEVKTVVDKIITYESSLCDPSWFKKMISISGDGFLDQQDLDIQWDTKEVSDGDYTIYAQSFRSPSIGGPIDEIPIIVDKTENTDITINHDDHLKTDTYPYLPIAEIVSPSPNNVLGKDDLFKIPSEGRAYCNSFNGWANLEYTDGVMHIRGKSYDPRPYGNETNIHVWIENDEDEIVFSEWRNNTEMYYEGEWVTGEETLKGGGGALYYMPSDFEREIVWASNGKIGKKSESQQNVIDALSQGAGFAFLSGHGSPNVWADHYPGVPGNRAHGDFTGLEVTSLALYSPIPSKPLFPMSEISNGDKLPVVLVGGCHNSQFNVSSIYGFYDGLQYLFNLLPILKNIKLPEKMMWCHGSLVPECFSWYMVKMKNGGAIASIGNTGLGYGILGKDCLIGGLDGGICIEFCKQYGQNGYDILGEAYSQTLTTYVQTFDITNQDHAKSLQQWVLLGDPSLKLGGYE